MIKLPIPIKGINSGITVSVTPSEFTTNMDNVRPRDVLENRVRMGQRPGLTKWSADRVGNDNQPVVEMLSVSSLL